MSVEDLKKEILRRQRVLPKLIANRDALDKKIAELQGLGELKAVPKRARKKLAKKRARKAMRADRAGSLPSKLAEVLQGKGRMSIAEVTEAVLAAGYKSKSKAFQKIVGMTLAKDKRFKRVRKGQYTLRD